MLLVPAVTVVGALLGFMAAARRSWAEIEADKSMVPLFVATSVALLVLVLLVPVVTVLGALLGFMAAAHIG